MHLKNPNLFFLRRGAQFIQKHDQVNKINPFNQPTSFLPHFSTPRIPSKPSGRKQDKKSMNKTRPRPPLTSPKVPRGALLVGTRVYSHHLATIILIARPLTKQPSIQPPTISNVKPLAMWREPVQNFTQSTSGRWWKARKYLLGQRWKNGFNVAKKVCPTGNSGTHIIGDVYIVDTSHWYKYHGPTPK